MVALHSFILEFLLWSVCLVVDVHARPSRATSLRAGRVFRRDAASVVGDPTLSRLLTQNEAWAEGMDKSYPGFFKQSAKAQDPKVLWIGCSDSRVPESVITSSLPGDIFVERNIANQVPSKDINVLSVLTYALLHLQVNRIVIAGHTHCGGVQYCYDQAVTLPKPAPSPLPPLPDPTLNAWLGGLYNRTVAFLNSDSTDVSDQDATLADLTRQNVKMQVENVAQLEIIRNAWKQGKDVRVVGWLYELETGRLKDLGICAGLMGTVGCEL